MGTTFKTLSARLRGATTELEQLGEEATVTTSKLRATVKALTGFDIMEEDGETFKSIYEILVGIGKEWEHLTDVERASLGEMLAGKRNSNALFAVLQNIKTLESAYETAQDSAGSAMEEQERYMQGIQYSVEQFKVALEDISNDLLDSDFAKSVVDFGTKVLTMLDKIIEHPLVTLLLTGGIGAVLGLRKFSSDGNGGFVGLYGAIYDVTQAYKKYIAAIYQCKDAQALDTAMTQKNIAVKKANKLVNQEEAYSEMAEAQADIAHSEAMKKNIATSEAETAQDIIQAKANVTEATTELSQTVKNGLKGIISAPKQILTGLVNLVKAIPALGIGSIFAAIGLAAVKTYNDIKKSEEQLKQSAKELGKEYSETKKELSDYKTEITELRAVISNSNSTVEESSNARERLLSIQDSLIEKYGLEKESINQITSAINGQVDALDKLSEREWRQKKREFESNDLAGIDKITQWWHGANSNLGVMLDEMENGYAKIKYNAFTNLNDRQLAKEIKDIFGGLAHGSDYSATGVIEINGNLSEIYNKLLLIQKTADEIGASDKAKESIESAISEIEETLDSYEEFYNEYVLQERIYNTPYEKDYQAYASAFESYRKALISGSEKDSKEAIESLANEYTSLYKRLLDDNSLSDTERNSILNFFDSLYPSLKDKIAQWKFTANVGIETVIEGTGKTQDQIVEEVKNEFKTKEELRHYNANVASPEQKQAYEDLKALLVARNASEEEFIGYLVQEGYYLQSIERQVSSFNIDYNIADIEAASTGIKSLQSTYQSLYDAMQEGKEGVDLAFLYSDLDSLKSSLKDADGNLVELGDTWNNFYNIMSDGNHEFEEMKNALNDVLTQYVNAVIDLENFDKAQANALSTQLQRAGVTKESADAYVSSMSEVVEVLDEAQSAGHNLIDNLDEEGIAFIKESDLADSTREHLAALVLQKQLTNGLTINTNGDVQNLKQLVSMAGITSDALAKLIKIKAILAKVDNKEIILPQERIDNLVLAAERLSQEASLDINKKLSEYANLSSTNNNGKGGSGGGGSEKDAWKEAYEKELAELNHIHELELISDIEYYEEREKLNDKYFKDREKYTEEYNKNLEEIYKGFQQAYKQYVDDMSDYWKKSLDAGLISFKQYCNNMESMLNDLHDAGKITDEVYYNSLADYYGTLVENMDKVVNAVQRRLKKEIDGLNKQKDALKDIYDARKKVVQDQIDSIQKEIDNLEEANKKRQEALDLQKALYNLNRAENQRPNLVYNSEKGYIYMNAEADIKEAQEELEDIRYQQKVSALETSIKSLEEQIDILDNELDTLTANLDAQIDKLQDYSDRWGEVANKYKEAQEDMIASAVLGSNWQNDILALNETTLNNFTNDYYGYMQAQADATLQAANSVVSQYHRMIDALNEWKRAQAEAAQTGYSTNANEGKTSITPSSPSGTRGGSSNLTNPAKQYTPSYNTGTAALKKQFTISTGQKNNPRQMAYGEGTKNAKIGWHEIAESGNEIVLDNYGNAFLAEGHQLHRFEGGERVYSSDETKELLSGKYIPVESILPNYSNMLSKIIDSGFNTSVNNMNNVLSSKSNLKKNADMNNIVNITVGDVHVNEVDNATQIAKAITNELPNALLQELNKR